MKSRGSHRNGLLTAGGILSIVGGAFEVIGGAIMVVLTMSTRILLMPRPPLYFIPPFEYMRIAIPGWLIVVGVPLLAVGIVAIVGGVSAVKRKEFGLSFVGAICALPSGILGILAVIFVALSKREFGTGGEENGI